MNRPFTILAGNWPKTGIALLENMIIAQCTALPKVLWSMPARGESVRVIQLYEKSTIKRLNLERHYTVTKQISSKKKKH